MRNSTPKLTVRVYVPASVIIFNLIYLLQNKQSKEKLVEAWVSLDLFTRERKREVKNARVRKFCRLFWGLFCLVGCLYQGIEMTNNYLQFDVTSDVRFIPQKEVRPLSVTFCFKPHRIRRIYQNRTAVPVCSVAAHFSAVEKGCLFIT